MSARTNKLVEFITRECRQYFRLMTTEEVLQTLRRYGSVAEEERQRRAQRMVQERKPVDFIPEIVRQAGGNRNRASKFVTRCVQEAARQAFVELEVEYTIPGSKLSIDMYDRKEKVAHELAFGDGSEIFKDVIKALIAGAVELTVYAYSYRNPGGMTGHDYVRRQLTNMGDNLPLRVKLVNFMRE